MNNESLSLRLLNQLSRPERELVLHCAGVEMKRRQRLPPDEIERLLPYLLRYHSADDREFATLIAEAGISLSPIGDQPDVEIRIPTRAQTDAIPLHYLLAGSAMVWELSARVAGSLTGCVSVAEELPPPNVTVSVGSISFSMGGGSLITGGIGFIVASHANVLPYQAAQFSYWGGALMTTLGIIDLALSWGRTIKELRRSDSGGVLERAKEKLDRAQTDASRLDAVPPSRLIPPEKIAAEARRFGLPFVVGTHLCNSALPAYDELIRRFPPGTSAHPMYRGAAVSAPTRSIIAVEAADSSEG